MKTFRVTLKIGISALIDADRYIERGALVEFFEDTASGGVVAVYTKSLIQNILEMRCAK
jgi:hypothetical protein